MFNLYVLSQDSESKVVGKEQRNWIGIGGVTRYPRYPRCMMYWPLTLTRSTNTP